MICQLWTMTICEEEVQHVTKKYDDATAILVGDAFQSLAFEILADEKTHPNPEIRCSLINELSKSSGFAGMVGGQMLDLEAEKKLNLEEILNLQRLKTGELFRFSCLASCILSDKSDQIPILWILHQNLDWLFKSKMIFWMLKEMKKRLVKKQKKTLVEVKKH